MNEKLNQNDVMDDELIQIIVMDVEIDPQIDGWNRIDGWNSLQVELGKRSVT